MGWGVGRGCVVLMRRPLVQPPLALTESELIAIMDKHGIGTDATIAEHIATVQKRGYAGVGGCQCAPWAWPASRASLCACGAAGRRYARKEEPSKRFFPTQLGLALVQGYDEMGFGLAKPHLRAKVRTHTRARTRTHTCKHARTFASDGS